MQPDALSRTIAAVQAYLTQHRPPGRAPTVTADSAFEHDLHCDPIDLICLEMDVGDALGVEFPCEPLACCETVGDLARLAESLIGKVEA